MDYKGYRIEGDKTYGMFLIKTSVGSLPDILKGSFTRTREATYAIDQYEIIKQEREDKPAPIKKVKLTPRELSPREVVDGTAEDDSGD